MYFVTEFKSYISPIVISLAFFMCHHHRSVSGAAAATVECDDLGGVVEEYSSPAIRPLECKAVPGTPGDWRSVFFYWRYTFVVICGFTYYYFVGQCSLVLL